MKEPRKSSLQWVLFLLAVAALTVGSFAAPSNATLNDANDAVAAPCPRSDSASCAFDPDTGWSYRNQTPVEE